MAKDLFTIRNPGPLLRLFHTFSRLGWYKFHSYKELSEASGLSYSQVWKLCERLSEMNWFVSRYSLGDPPVKLVRPARDSYTFTDGFVKYTVSVTLLGGFEVDVSFD